MGFPELGEFPWDLLTPYEELARSHPDGIINLSIGTPVDPVPNFVQAALAAGANAPGYPPTIGTATLRATAINWLSQEIGVRGLTDQAVFPTIGSKELVALLPLLMGAEPGSRVIQPTLAYPTYSIGAAIARCAVERCDTPPSDAENVALVWLNSPANPTGQVLTPAQLRDWVAWGREHGVPIVSDECYLELYYDKKPTSILHPEVSGDDHAGVLGVFSLSKRSNLAGYRAGLIAGDPDLVSQLLAVRKHAGLIVPAPVQGAIQAALADREHVAEQRARYAARRAILRPALEKAGFRVEHSDAGLYLWLTRDEECWTSVRWLAERGILVAPGIFYGEGGQRYVRAAFTASDNRIAAAADRLTRG